MRSLPIRTHQILHGVTTFTKYCNFLGNIVAIILYYYLTIYWCDYYFTFDTVISIYLAEHCGWANDRILKESESHERAESGVNPNLSLVEKGVYRAHSNHSPKLELGCIAAIVGYREDPVIFTKALESYLDVKGCQFVLTCIDGNDPEDQKMVEIFQKVYSSDSALLNLPVPLVDIALKMDHDSNTWTQDTAILEKCVALAKQTLLDNNIHLTGPDAITRLCVTQPHMHKKGVMFTSFILCFALSDLLNIDFVWTSDSDSWVFKDTIDTTIRTIHGDDKCAGASTALVVHNRKESLVTTLGHAIYLNELHFARTFSSAVGASECQSGPCAAFRISALRPELLAWYKQTVFGNWMVINEDRHLTTRLLLQGYRVRYLPRVKTATESPVTLRRWLLQQVRWGRAGHIEAFVHPSLYVKQPPLFFFGALRREITALILFTTIMSYVLVGVSPFLRFQPRDFLLKFVFTAVYLKVRNPINPTWGEWIWSVPGAIFGMVPGPGVHAWSFVTMGTSEWGTSMRGELEKKEKNGWTELKKKVWELGFFVVWMGIMGGMVGRYVSSELGLDAWMKALYMGVGTTVMWGIFGCWVISIKE
ncbi:hypothetical protein BKA63DRAFT_575370 [Paraphoma chrysanthemicola]|nr:hypothetical protein BKA63DRAFT_575370 [Paraphoma chrysanthemicola]